MKKKKLLIGLMCAATIVVSGIGSYLYSGSKVAASGNTEFKMQKYKLGVNNVDTVSNSQLVLDLEENATEEKIVDSMHKMLHQKIKASEKWGAIPMTQTNIQVLKKTIEKNNYEHKQVLMNMVNNWIEKDFNNVVNEHNYLWDLQEGTIGKATEKMNQIEEQTFCLNNFGDEMTAKMTKDKDIKFE